MRYNVAIIGGGPGGSTCGAFLLKYDSSLKVVILERETFPREHVGESQLPIIGGILDELGVWDKIEAAGFPIKVGATYRWGNTDDLWHFNFIPNGDLGPEPRPARFEGQRQRTAFQVDRALYDQILLDYAQNLGCEVRQSTKVSRVVFEGEQVKHLELADGTTVEADCYIDASGHSGILRRAAGVEVEYPTSLQNVAFWDYWQNAKWAESIGVGGTRVQVMSLGYGWLWFIPIGPTRTSVGLVCPADYYKKSGKRPEEIYREAIAAEPRISDLMVDAVSEGLFTTTKDWSFLAERLTGPNWMLVGEAAGFADPILAAGLSLTHSSAREAAFTYLEMSRGGDKAWLLEQYNSRNRRRILQHIRFADYWYTNNSHFSDLKEFTRQIAADAGLDLDAETAFQWLGTGGFVEEDMLVGGLGTVSFNGLHQISKRLSQVGSHHAYGGFNTFTLNFEGSREVLVPYYREGKVHQVPAFERDGKVLPIAGPVGLLVKGLEGSPHIASALEIMSMRVRSQGATFTAAQKGSVMESLEALIRDGWVVASVSEGEAALAGELMPNNPFFQDA